MRSTPPRLFLFAFLALGLTAAAQEPLEPPTLTSVALSSSTVEITIEPLTQGADWYRFESFDGGDWQEAFWVEGAQTSHLVEGLAPGTTYYWRATQWAGEFESAFSDYTEATTPVTPGGFPAAPEDFIASYDLADPEAIMIHFRWADRSDNESYFEIRCAPSEGGPPVTIARLGAGSTSHSVSPDDLPVLDGRWTIVAGNEVGESELVDVIPEFDAFGPQ